MERIVKVNGSKGELETEGGIVLRVGNESKKVPELCRNELELGVRPPPICVGENRRPWRKKGKELRIGHCRCDDAGCTDGAGDVGTFEGDEDSKEVSNFGSFDRGRPVGADGQM